MFSRGREPGVGAGSPSSEPLIRPSVSRDKSKRLKWDTDRGGAPGRAQGGLRTAGEEASTPSLRERSCRAKRETEGARDSQTDMGYTEGRDKETRAGAGEAARPEMDRGGSQLLSPACFMQWRSGQEP